MSLEKLDDIINLEVASQNSHYLYYFISFVSMQFDVCFKYLLLSFTGNLTVFTFPRTRKSQLHVGHDTISSARNKDF